MPNLEEKILEEYETEFLEMNSDWSDFAKKSIPKERLDLQTAANEGWNRAREVAKILVPSIIKQVQEEMLRMLPPENPDMTNVPDNKWNAGYHQGWNDYRKEAVNALSKHE